MRPTCALATPFLLGVALACSAAPEDDVALDAGAEPSADRPLADSLEDGAGEPAPDAPARDDPSQDVHTEPVLDAAADLRSEPGPPSTLSGLVTDWASGAPLDEVSVRLADGSGEPATTDASGHYVLVVPEGAADIVFTKSGYCDLTAAVLVLEGGSTLDVQILGSQATIDLTVTADTGWVGRITARSPPEHPRINSDWHYFGIGWGVDPPLVLPKCCADFVHPDLDPICGDTYLGQAHVYGRLAGGSPAVSLTVRLWQIDASLGAHSDAAARYRRVTYRDGACGGALLVQVSGGGFTTNVGFTAPCLRCCWADPARGGMPHVTTVDGAIYIPSP